MSQRGVTVFGSPEAFAGDMRRIVNDDKFSDITFLVGGGGGEKDKVKMYAHKVILAARCEVFQAMFTEQKKQAASSKTRVSVENIPLVLPDVRPSGRSMA